MSKRASKPNVDFESYVVTLRGQAHAGDARAQLQLGTLLQWGDGVEQDYDEALKWFVASANNGDSGGLVKLAQAYREGLGVERDLGEAIHLYCEASRWGHAAAPYHLAVMMTRQEGLSRDDLMSYKLLRLAADRGF